MTIVDSIMTEGSKVKVVVVSRVVDATLENIVKVVVEMTGINMALVVKLVVVEKLVLTLVLVVNINVVLVSVVLLIVVKVMIRVLV